jgi:hypothetical protein
MKSPMPLQCGCGEKFALEIVGSIPPEHAQCPKCHSSGYVFKPLGNLVTKLLMERAKQELVHNDITICTLLSAVAVEAEMAYLFFKWKAIDAKKLPAEQTPEVRKPWENEWANMRSIGKRLDELSRLLTGKPFDEFACLNKELFKSALTSYNPGSSIKDFLQGQFFEKRNDIVHFGRIDFQEADGKRSLSLATALLNLFHAMDVKRYDLTFPKK